MRSVSSSTTRKSSPLGCPELNAPPTFSQHEKRGRTWMPVRPRSISAFLISLMIRICSMKRPERAPASPALAPAMDKSWQGLPPQMISTGGSSAPLSLVMSPKCSIPGRRSFVTRMGNGSISDAHSGITPLCSAASGKPPIPSNKLPSVSTRATWSRLILPPQRLCGSGSRRSAPYRRRS